MWLKWSTLQVFCKPSGQPAVLSAGGGGGGRDRTGRGHTPPHNKTKVKAEFLVIPYSVLLFFVGGGESNKEARN